MATYLESTIQRRIGLSSDSKPAAPIGSFFWEYDTGLMYKCYDGTNYAIYDAASDIGTRVFTSTASSTTTLTCAALADVAGEYVGQQVIPLQGAMAGEGRYITAYNGTNQITISPAWAADPGAATAGIIQFAIVSGALGYTAAEVQTSSVATAGGSNATTTRAGLLTRWLVDNAAKTTELISAGVIDFNATAKASIQAEAAAALAATANKRQVGVKQIFQKVLTTALTNGTQDVTVATVTSQDFDTVSVSLRSNGAQPASLVSVALYAGASKVLTLISPADGARANIAAADQQVCWPNPPGGKCTLAATKTFVATLVGTGTDAIDITFTFSGEACADGGYLA